MARGFLLSSSAALFFLLESPLLRSLGSGFAFCAAAPRPATRRASRGKKEGGDVTSVGDKLPEEGAEAAATPARSPKCFRPPRRGETPSGPPLDTTVFLTRRALGAPFYAMGPTWRRSEFIFNEHIFQQHEFHLLAEAEPNLMLV